ncbi:GNAT family N-acetyltransferase [Arsukibacterium sp.]|uniref:GNAT family N-acetyltransferase n=1 Tax=Arsukibacterium sp. TaxID=1977258 RepID=UPI002FDA730B
MSSPNACLALLQQQLAQAKARHCRLPVLWQGEQSEILQQLQQLHQQLQPAELWWIGEQALAEAKPLQAKKPHQLLGQECDWLIINAFSGLAADTIAAASGSVKAGGLWLVLAPVDDLWQQLANPAQQSLLSYPYQASQLVSYFSRFWQQQLQQANLLHLQQDDAEPGQLTQHISLKLPDWPAAPIAPTHAVPHSHFATAEQACAVAAIIKVATGHRRRPLLLLADRGRGKSAALGIAAAMLAQQGKSRIVITAPAAGQAAIALAHSKFDAAGTLALNFWPIDQLLQQQPEADIVLVDEAAAIPSHLLQQLVTQYSRLVFASTVHGYEGTGRGFQLRFLPYLQHQFPGLQQLTLQQPVRYQQHDPLEQLLFDSFLLKQTYSDYQYQPTQQVRLLRYQAADWLQQTDKLQQVFSLLTLAHYQTQVKDLAMLLDNPALQLYSLEQNQQVLAVALISIEGSVEPEMCQQIYSGQRRIQGHLLAQSLAFHLAQPQLASLPLARVMRISVAPPLQQQGLGSLLLDQLQQQLQPQCAFLGSSFGATPALIRFWRKAGLLPIRLGHSIDKASAEPSVLMLKCLTPFDSTSSDELLAHQPELLHQRFAAELIASLPDYPAQLDFALLKPLLTPSDALLSQQDQQLLLLFARQQRPYEISAMPLRRWFLCHFHLLNDTEGALFCARFWQHQSWPVLAKRFGLPGKAQLIEQMRLILANYLL